MGLIEAERIILLQGLFDNELIVSESLMVEGNDAGDANSDVDWSGDPSVDSVCCTGLELGDGVDGRPVSLRFTTVARHERIVVVLVVVKAKNS